MANRTLSEQDMVDVLEEIVRESQNAAAKIAAIKMLREWDAGEAPSQSDFGQLYEIGKPPLRTKTA